MAATVTKQIPAVVYDDVGGSDGFFLIKIWGMFAGNAENTFVCLKICNEGLNLPIHPRQFSKRDQVEWA